MVIQLQNFTHKNTCSKKTLQETLKYNFRPYELRATQYVCINLLGFIPQIYLLHPIWSVCWQYICVTQKLQRKEWLSIKNWIQTVSLAACQTSYWQPQWQKEICPTSTNDTSKETIKTPAHYPIKGKKWGCITVTTQWALGMNPQLGFTYVMFLFVSKLVNKRPKHALNFITQTKPICTLLCSTTCILFNYNHNDLSFLMHSIIVTTVFFPFTHCTMKTYHIFFWFTVYTYLRHHAVLMHTLCYY